MENERVQHAKEFLKKLSEHHGVSGYERTIAPLVIQEFQTIAEEVQIDRFGNIYAHKNGEVGRYKIMLAAHMDEIGLMVKKIDPRGFLRFTTVGGVDQRTLLSQEVIIHGRQPIPGVIGAMPPHLVREDGDKAVKIEDMGIDVGLSFVEIQKMVQIGDVITLKRTPLELLGGLRAGKSLDDRAGVVVMQICLQELDRLHHAHDVIAVTTTQEEVGLRGALTSAYTLNPDLAIAIDVTHAATPDTKGQVSIELGKGPAIALGPNIHPLVYASLTEVAQNERIPFQIEPVAGMTGTDAWAIQVAQAGIPTGLLSIPLRYMHTSVETLDMQDVINSGLLLAHFIASLPEDLEGSLCY
ncbi:peptidase M42 [Desulfitobacterium metallireducens DSM 15288]|uniref:Peptidase M42 n=1 Tax=Desulfitobacterium metallireducens DSM 15288 TaxID=871968 RepID=W0EBL6_9FIRM|nr:M42 family metallopeptidase [Desulfitobacterium metallireducens]AHF06928.1 peptidase M42 [Desulfitobacterium metallireducens DSM 15288]